MSGLFSLKVHKHQKNYMFIPCNIPQKVPLDTWNAILINQLIFFSPRSQNSFRSRYENDLKFKFLEKVFFSSVRSSGYLECRYDDPAEFLFARNANFFNQNTKMTKNSFSKKKNFCSHSSPRQIVRSEDNRAEVVTSKFSKKCLEVQKRSKRTDILSRNRLSSKCSPGHSDCIFDNPAKIFPPKSRNVFAQNRKILKSFVLLQEKFSHKLFPWTPSLHFWQNSLEIFRHKLDNFLQVKFENHEEKFHFAKNQYRSAPL